MQIYKKDNTQKFRNDPFSITHARVCLALPLTPCGKRGTTQHFHPFPDSGNEKWIVKIVKSEKCITISLFSQLCILWLGKFSHKSLAKTMQRQHKEEEGEEEEDDGDEETLSRDRVCDLGTPINYRKCHFKCRESHNVHNQFKFWQIWPTPFSSQPSNKRERQRGRERARDRMRSWRGSCSRPSRQEFDICIIIISKLSEGWFPPFLPLSCFLAYRIRLLPFAFNRFPYLCVYVCMCVCVRLHLAATDKFAYQCNGYYLFSLFSFIPNESKISCKAATSS